MNVLPLVFAAAALAGSACAPARTAAEGQPIRSTVANAGMKSDSNVEMSDDNGRAPRRVVVFTSEGEQLHTQALDAQTGELSLVASVTLPQPVHYAVADPAARFLYVSASNGSTENGLYTYRIDPQTGALAEHGRPLVPPLGRIIHLSIDPTGRHLVLAHNRAAQLSSVGLDADGSLAGFIEQAAPARTGFFAHQALLDAAGTGLVACGLGAAATDAAPEQPGSLSVFRFEDGQLTERQSVRPGPGLGPRHLDYRGDRVFVAMERGNRLFSYRYRGGVLDEQPEFDLPTLMDPGNVREGQRAGAIHVHPKGRYVYLSNRATRSTSATVAGQPAEVFAGGENDIALFALDPASGEPRPVDHYDTRGFEPRTFTIEPSGRFLIVANQSQRNVLDASGAISSVPRSVAVFEIGDDGRLKYLRKYELSHGELFWIGSLQLPG